MLNYTMDPLCTIADQVTKAANKSLPLSTRVHNLPPELFNHILDYTFALNDEPEDALLIESTQQIPSIMQVDTKSRDELARQLYLRDQPIFCANQEVAARWLLSLPKNHRNMLREVRIGTPLNESAQKLDSGNLVAKMQWGFIMHSLLSKGVELDDGVLVFKILAPAEKEGEERRSVWTSEII